MSVKGCVVQFVIFVPMHTLYKLDLNVMKCKCLYVIYF